MNASIKDHEIVKKVKIEKNFKLEPLRYKAYKGKYNFQIERIIIQE